MLDPLSLLDEETEPTGVLQESIREVPRETVWTFVLAVLLAQAGLFGVSLGLKRWIDDASTVACRTQGPIQGQIC